MRDSQESTIAQDAIAVVGMAVRLPGAPNLDAFWSLLENGDEAIKFYTAEELVSAGMPPSMAGDPELVAARGHLPDVDLFDANFFGISPREAALMDPQHRVMMEVAWHAMEHAGYDPARWEGRTGIYTSAGMNTYLPFNLFTNSGLIEEVGGFQLSIYNDKDFVPTRIAYALDSRGPAVDIGTACSSSLVGLNIACSSLTGMQCDAALVGGITIHLPQESGEMPQVGSAYSPDGHCRPFDATSSGLVDGNGAVAVVLKRLEDAQADGDTIHGVILASAVNNDGSDKVGYSAPSIDGQAEVILEAQALAGVEADQISYIEAHGTATSLGDPIELAGLTQAFRETTDKRRYCALGAVKSNIGHVDKAAGLAGVVKTLLALKHESIPATVHWQAPNPRLDLENSPFYLSGESTPWPRLEGSPRIAGVSSFGVGGTNAHAILAEAPESLPRKGSSEPQLLVLSAKTQKALQAQALLLKNFLPNCDAPLSDIANTLQIGRRRLDIRTSMVCDDIAELLEHLDRLPDQDGLSENQSLAFLFSGQGTQYVGMGAGLYGAYDVFKTTVDYCANRLLPKMRVDIRDVLFKESASEAQLRQTALAQPALFTLEYALAQLLISLGLTPSTVLGHSLGEYVACCVAGLMSIEDALDLVAIRGQLMQAMPTGSMLAVSLSESDLEAAIAALDMDIDLAAVNGMGQCVISGADKNIAIARDQLVAKGVIVRELETSHAFHSRMMEPMLDEFSACLEKVTWQRPNIDILSNLSGEVVDYEQLASADYWCRHLRQPVRFAQCLETLAERDERAIWLELGPGRALTGLAGMRKRAVGPGANLPTLPPAQNALADQKFFLGTLGKLWERGMEIDWQALGSDKDARRIPLPLYPFESRRHWIDPGNRDAGAAESSVPGESDACFYKADWALAGFSGQLLDGAKSVQVSGDKEDPLLLSLVSAYEAKGHRVISPEDSQDLPDLLVHILPVSATGDGQVEALETLLTLTRRVLSKPTDKPVRFILVGEQLLAYSGSVADPKRTALLGVLRTLPHEYAEIRCLAADIKRPEREHDLALTAQRLLGESLLERMPESVVLRRGERWAPRFVAQTVGPLADSGLLRAAGSYLVIGGASAIGLIVARALAASGAGELILTAAPGEDITLDVEGESAWPDTCEIVTKPLSSGDSQGLAGLLDSLSGISGIVDVTDFHQEKPFGLLQTLETTVLHGYWQTQRAWLEALRAAGERLDPDFCMVMSSLATQTGAAGQLASTAQGLYLQSLAQQENQSGRVPWYVVFWDKWSAESQDQKSITPDKGKKLLQDLFNLAEPANLIVALAPPELRRAEFLDKNDGVKGTQSGAGGDTRAQHDRPELGTKYSAPESALEVQIAGIWEQFLGIEQIGINDDFFALGGNSLLGAQLVAEINQACVLGLDLSSLFAAPTIGNLAKLVLETKLAEHDLSDLEAELEQLESLSEEEVEALMNDTDA
ncbi:MAG: beta-ketoacyl synthase N-terminal-like domain-containing protein [Congregibacter sp.]